ncbi:Golgi reassembly stacking protein GRASP65, contains PDZ domain [Plasmopara halstedii]|uniref:Golgi reassembly stacking protein GRASP65, contains PDZ domain n=1 Tax=Plasmopara halstedii TaxID=4781 RepID=A0A0P1AHK2_PLAHL|nr:Golgi reassembly stacking protein GRASP65, contains PDZ domain [Plasmopara halstedii]CEG40462.1 Golgi reassembly stacking protein GRASP65, contains PDZ domain [Plasmopara halstedii]|eukprot:XP_024576831.1 Golgi reassembly stacking protein GRASP65, contains PDZ domain [Plasmopara halstedii]
MGNESSSLGEVARSSDEDENTVEGGKCYGFRVIGIQELSPASDAGFVSFFDFILEANGIRLDTKDATFMELIAHSEDRPMQLKVYNVKAQTTRELQLTPSRKWPGKGLLGVTIRFDSYEGAEDHVLHILSVAESSPAERAGLRADSDYLLGTPERVFADAEDLHDEILDALDGSFQCYVYNSLEDQVRIVSIVPTERWGGEGILGAEVGHGYLHRLPSVCRKTIGASVGFVQLPKEAKAATDAFLKPQRRNDDNLVTTTTSSKQQKQEEVADQSTRDIVENSREKDSSSEADQVKYREQLNQELGDARLASKASETACLQTPEAQILINFILPYYYDHEQCKRP